MAKGTVAVAKEGKKKPSKLHAVLHPPYFQMISEAISSLKDRTGSSQQAISKFIEEKHNKGLPPNFKKILSIQLKKFVKSEKLFKVKNSFKISEIEKVKMRETLMKETSNLTAKKTEKEKVKKEASNLKSKKTVAKTISEKAKKMKRLSQVKTPEVLKKKDMKKTTVVVIEKTKKLSQGKSPTGLKKNLTPMKRKGSKAVISSSPATKKARK